MSEPIAGGQRSPSLETEEGRAFYQDRIALAGKTMFLLSAGFLTLGGGLGVALAPNYHFTDLLREHGNRWHFAAALVSLTVWVVGRGRPLSRATLSWLDGAGTVVLMTAYSMMAWDSIPEARFHFVVLLVSMVVQMGRAVLVPSTARTTLIIGIVASIPVLVLSHHLGSHATPQTMVGADVLGVFAAVYASLWCAVIIIMSTLSSRLIFGLRKSVRDAMRLGQYTLEDKIGEGGMGSVYRARHAMLRRPTAIKLLPPERAGADRLARFEREVQMTSRLTHPNTISVFDYGRTPEGIFYYAMEYLDGVDLQQLVEETGPQPPARVVHILVQICGALAEAHRVGLVHRDIKPANVLLCERGGIPDVAKVLDFGLVKELDSSATEASMAATGTQTVLGTPLYLAPESIRTPGDVDARSDLYSVGALAYFLLTGVPPFTGKTVFEVCGHHLHLAPTAPSERLGKALPAELEKIVLACLAKAPGERPQSADELREALERCDLRWTTADARAWWKAHPVGPDSGKKVAYAETELAPGKTVTIALAGRAASD